MANKLKPKSYFSKSHLSVFLIIFAVIGLIILIKSLAAPNPSLPGDLNNDDTVNITDMSILLSNYGTTDPTKIAQADINGDGAVNVLDMSILLSNYGKSVTSTSNGVFTGSYFNNATLSGTPVLTRTDNTINFDWGSGSPDPSVPADNFSVRWIGNFTFEAATYTFNVTTNDGMRIYVDNNLILDQWQDQAASFSPTYTATAGTHQVKVEYYEGANTAKAQVSWTKQTTGGGGGTGTISWNINYETGNTSQWSGGIQCAGTNDTGYTYGTMSVDTTTFGEGTHGARIDLPSDTINGGSRCEGLEARRPIYGSDHWYGMMYKFPTNWQEPSSAFWGMAIAQLNYQLIWGAPVLLAAHADKVDLTINTGFCADVNSTKPGCTYSSTNGSSIGNVPETKIIPGPIVTNNWYEVIVHAKWTGDPTQGIIEGWYRLKGQTTWNKTVNLTGYPTIQWSNSAPLSVWQGNPSFNVNDKFGAYRGQSTFPITFWHDNIMDGTDFNAVSSHMP